MIPFVVILASIALQCGLSIIKDEDPVALVVPAFVLDSLPRSVSSIGNAAALITLHGDGVVSAEWWE
ncbi:MAG: hypothetical protein HZY76_11320 [Anaerolineae bacterium]|nr:MAG: hypothetical protein HZY76_11320 [Anaerolineae bacterium]